MSKLKFEQIKKVALGEQYIGSELEMAAFISDEMTVANILKTRGYSPESAAQFVELIQAGYSESEALMLLK